MKLTTIFCLLSCLALVACKTTQNQFLNTSYNNSNEQVCSHYIDDYAKTGKQGIVSIEEQTYLRVMRQAVTRRGLNLERCIKLIDDHHHKIADNIFKVGTAILAAAILNEQLNTSSYSSKDISSSSYEDLQQRYKRSVQLALAAGVPRSKIAVPNYKKYSSNQYSKEATTTYKQITSASAGFSIPQPPATSHQVNRTSRPLTAVSPGFKAQQPLVKGGCTCSCVNGTVQALCSSIIDIKPICSPRVCPPVTSSVKPIHTPTVPPIGANQCDLQQVYNESNKRYEWKEICFQTD